MSAAVSAAAMPALLSVATPLLTAATTTTAAVATINTDASSTINPLIVGGLFVSHWMATNYFLQQYPDVGEEGAVVGEPMRMKQE